MADFESRYSDQALKTGVDMSDSMEVYQILSQEIQQDGTLEHCQISSIDDRVTGDLDSHSELGITGDDIFDVSACEETSHHSSGVDMGYESNTDVKSNGGVSSENWAVYKLKYTWTDCYWSQDNYGNMVSCVKPSVLGMYELLYVVPANSGVITGNHSKFRKQRWIKDL